MPHFLASALSCAQVSSVHRKECTLDGGLLVIFFFFMSMTIDERDEIIAVKKKDKVCEPASSPRNF